ncbi:MAG: hypothetical protein ACLQL2_08000 [Methylovirgula sp.]
MAKDKQRRGSKAPASRAGTKKRAAIKKPAAKKPVAKKAATKSAAKKPAAKPAAARKITARKSVPIKTARVSKRALLPPLPPPPTSPLKAARSAARHPSRSKALGRAKVAKRGRAVFEIPACTEVVLRQKLRLAAPYVELWLVQRETVLAEADGLTPEAAFVRIWQWLMLEAALEGGQVVITPDLVEKLFAEEMGRAPTA